MILSLPFGLFKNKIKQLRNRFLERLNSQGYAIVAEMLIVNNVVESCIGF